MLTTIFDKDELTDLERTYYEYHGKLDDGICIVDLASLEGRLIA